MSAHVAVGVLLAAGTAWVSMRIGRSISSGINQLRAGAEGVGSGNLDHRINLNTDDEPGRLSGAFDAMTRNLKAITVSRDDLAKEIGEAKKAEEGLPGIPLRRYLDCSQSGFEGTENPWADHPKSEWLGTTTSGDPHRFRELPP